MADAAPLADKVANLILDELTGERVSKTERECAIRHPATVRPHRLTAAGRQ